MTRKRKGQRCTPKGTQDPNRREVARISADPEAINAFLVANGFKPKAQARSGWCMSCGKKLNRDTAVGPVDHDHSVCDACFPEDLNEEWLGKTVDVVDFNLTTGEITEGKGE